MSLTNDPRIEERPICSYALERKLEWIHELQFFKAEQYEISEVNALIRLAEGLIYYIYELHEAIGNQEPPDESNTASANTR